MLRINLGLGTNLGNRINNLRTAILAISQIQHVELIKKSSVFQSKALLKSGAPSHWNMDFFNCCISINSDLSPIELFTKLKKIEAQMGRNLNADVWSPRIIDIDILTWGNQFYHDETLCIPHNALLERSFVLIPLLQIDPLWVHPQFLDLNLHLLAKQFEPLPYANYCLDGAKLMGILNLSVNSFSRDGVDVNNLEEVKNKFIELVNAGAEIIDVGAMSSKPNAELLTFEQEWNILKPFLDKIRQWLDLPELMIRPEISIDTYRYQIVERLLDYPIDFINDISGSDASKICALIRNTPIKYIFMHNCGQAGKEYLDLQISAIAQILSFFENKKEKLLSWGLTQEQIIFDVGIGFGKHSFQVKDILNHLKKLKPLGVEVLVGHSRKATAMPSANCLRAEHRDFETALVSKDISPHVNYLRLHNIKLSQRAIKYKAV